MSDPSEVAELPFTIKEKLASLANALKEQNNGYVNALNFIHKECLAHPEYVYALSDEEFVSIVNGYERYTKVSIDVGKLTKKSAALLSPDDI